MSVISVCSYRDLENVCRALGLSCKNTKKGILWYGTVNGKYIRISIHIHQQGKDIPTELFRRYVKDLDFDSVDEFMKFLNEI